MANGDHMIFLLNSFGVGVNMLNVGSTMANKVGRGMDGVLGLDME